MIREIGQGSIIHVNGVKCIIVGVENQSVYYLPFYEFVNFNNKGRLVGVTEDDKESWSDDHIFLKKACDQDTENTVCGFVPAQSILTPEQNDYKTNIIFDDNEPDKYPEGTSGGNS
jgi:hypothetical protein